MPPEEPPHPAEEPSHLSLEESRRIVARRRGRNWALLAVLGGLALLFFAISIVKLTKS